MKKLSLVALSPFVLAASLALAPAANAADYLIDTKGAHASISFQIKHLGYSWLKGAFNTFSGQFSWDDAHPEKTKIDVSIETASIDSNHSERDKHLRSSDFLDTDTYPKATFTSTAINVTSKTTAQVTGNFTLHGVTKPIVIDVEKVGEGKDPWGGYRAGFEGRTSFALVDFGITRNLGPASKNVDLHLSVEGIRQ